MLDMLGCMRGSIGCMRDMPGLIGLPRIPRIPKLCARIEAMIPRESLQKSPRKEVLESPTRS